MPRLNSGQELFRKLDTLQVFRQAGSTQTTLAAAVTAAQGTVNVASASGFSANDSVVIVGQNGAELNGITAVTPTTAVPLLYPAAVAQPSGSLLYRVTASNLAHIAEEGVRFSGSAPLTPINSALAGAPIGYLYGYGEFQAQLALLGLNGLNLQTIFGITESEIGTGASTAPYAVALLGANIGSQGIQCVRLVGTRVDGATVIVDFNDCKIEPQGDVQFARASVTQLPLLLRCTSVVYRQYA